MSDSKAEVYKTLLDWTHFLNCLRRVLPSNEDEERARDSGIAFVKGLKGLKAFGLSGVGPTRGSAKRYWGELRPVDPSNPGATPNRNAHQAVLP